jgi:hypothetical protein
MLASPDPKESTVADYELVRVATELVEQLLAEEPRRVVLVGLERHEDETLELTFRTPDDGDFEATVLPSWRIEAWKRMPPFATSKPASDEDDRG